MLIQVPYNPRQDTKFGLLKVVAHANSPVGSSSPLPTAWAPRSAAAFDQVILVSALISRRVTQILRSG